MNGNLIDRLHMDLLCYEHPWNAAERIKLAKIVCRTARRLLEEGYDLHADFTVEETTDEPERPPEGQGRCPAGPTEPHPGRNSGLSAQSPTQRETQAAESKEIRTFRGEENRGKGNPAEFGLKCAGSGVNG